MINTIIVVVRTIIIAARKNRLLARTESMDGYSRKVDMLNMYSSWWENTSTVIT